MIITDGEKIKAFGKGKLYISRDGEIFDNNFTRLNVEYDVKTGKPCIRIYNGGIELFFVETLVARTFVKKFAPGQQYIIHINEDVQDNRACNLKWVDAYEFMKHPADSNSYLKKSTESVYPVKDNRDKYMVDGTGSLVEIEKKETTPVVEKDADSLGIANKIINEMANAQSKSYVGKRLGETPEVRLPDDLKEIEVKGKRIKFSKSGRVVTLRKEINIDKYFDKRFDYRYTGIKIQTALIELFDNEAFSDVGTFMAINYLYHPSIINITNYTSSLSDLAVYRLEGYSSDKFVFELMRNDTCIKTFSSYSAMINYWSENYKEWSYNITGFEKKGVYIKRKKEFEAPTTYYWRLTLPHGTVISKCPRDKFEKWERPTYDYTVLSIADTVQVLETVNSKIIGSDYFDTKSIRNSIRRHAITNNDATITDMASKVFKRERTSTVTKDIAPIDHFKCILEMQTYPNTKEVRNARPITIKTMNKYMVTNTGHIVDMKTETFVPEYLKTDNFYVFVNIEGIEYRVDELVIYAFYKKNPDDVEDKVIVHRNNNTMDNRLSNLKFVKKEDEGRYLPEWVSNAN